SSRFGESDLLKLSAALLDLLELVKHLARFLRLVQSSVVPGEMIERGGIARTQNCRLFEKRNCIDDFPLLLVHLSQLDIGVGQLGVEVDRFLKNRARFPRSEDTRLNSSHLVISYAVFCLKK